MSGLGHCQGSLRPSPRSVGRQATREEMRTMISLIACVCDDPGVQVMLPQIVLVRATSTNKGDVVEIRSALAGNVSVWIESRAWTTSNVMLGVLRALGTAAERGMKSPFGRVAVRATNTSGRFALPSVLWSEKTDRGGSMRGGKRKRKAFPYLCCPCASSHAHVAATAVATRTYHWHCMKE